MRSVRGTRNRGIETYLSVDVADNKDVVVVAAPVEKNPPSAKVVWLTAAVGVGRVAFVAAVGVDKAVAVSTPPDVKKPPRDAPVDSAVVPFPAIVEVTATTVSFALPVTDATGAVMIAVAAAGTVALPNADAQEEGRVTTVWLLTAAGERRGDMVSLRRAGMIVELRRGRRPLGVRSGVAVVVVVVSAVVVAVGAGTLTKLVERRTVPDSVLVATLCEAIPETIPAMLSKGAAVVAVAVLDATADVPVALARVEDGAGSAVELEVA
jgi:hypothetical protein